MKKLPPINVFKEEKLIKSVKAPVYIPVLGGVIGLALLGAYTLYVAVRTSMKK